MASTRANHWGGGQRRFWRLNCFTTDPNPLAGGRQRQHWRGHVPCVPCGVDACDSRPKRQPSYDIAAVSKGIEKEIISTDAHSSSKSHTLIDDVGLCQNKTNNTRGINIYITSYSMHTRNNLLMIKLFCCLFFRQQNDGVERRRIANTLPTPAHNCTTQIRAFQVNVCNSIPVEMLKKKILTILASHLARITQKTNKYSDS